jgi:hypothetical protein
MQPSLRKIAQALMQINVQAGTHGDTIAADMKPSDLPLPERPWTISP